MSGPYIQNVPILTENMIGEDAADFVDIIHSDGDMKPSALVHIPPEQGDLHHLGREQCFTFPLMSLHLQQTPQLQNK